MTETVPSSFQDNQSLPQDTKIHKMKKKEFHKYVTVRFYSFLYGFS